MWPCNKKLIYTEMISHTKCLAFIKKKIAERQLSFDSSILPLRWAFFCIAILLFILRSCTWTIALFAIVGRLWIITKSITKLLSLATAGWTRSPRSPITPCSWTTQISQNMKTNHFVPNESRQPCKKPFKYATFL